MNIIINGRPLHFPYVGTGVYVRNLLEWLPLLDNTNSYSVVCNAVDGIDIPSHIKRMTTGRPIEVSSLKGQYFWEQVVFPRKVHHNRADLVHVPYLGGSYFNSCPSIVTAFDLIPYVLPDYRPHSLGHKVYLKTQAGALRKADHIITASHFSKSEISEYFQIDLNRISVIPLAVDKALFQASNDIYGIERIKKKYSLHKPFILYVGGVDRRKNLETLVDAYTKLDEDLRSHYDCIIVGTLVGDNPYHQLLLRRIENSGRSSEVKVIPTVPVEDLRLLYSAASLFVYPSRYEGFGLPPLEAMACGTPVVATKATSVPEVVGEGALLFSPDSADELAQCITCVLMDDSMRALLIEKGLLQARSLTWEKTALKTLELYQQICKSK